MNQVLWVDQIAGAVLCTKDSSCILIVQRLEKHVTGGRSADFYPLLLIVPQQGGPRALRPC